MAVGFVVKPTKPSLTHPFLGVWPILAYNLVIIAVGIIDNWSIATALLIYVFQSFVIGLTFLLRLHKMKKFSPLNASLNKKPLGKTRKDKLKFGYGFMYIYVMFNVFYVIAIFSWFKPDVANLMSVPSLAAALSIIIGQLVVLRQQVRVDKKQITQISPLAGDLILRVFLMHFVIVSGAFLFGNIGGLIVFQTVKTIFEILGLRKTV